ncbi:molybdopterin-guanine dinucleotide biosynthesis protein A [Roseimarinus sediminis]
MKQLNENITGVVMAGGKSSRMGSDKGLLDFEGKPMVKYAIDLLSAYFKTLIISSNDRNYEMFNLPLVPDFHKNCGPICGLHAVMQQVETPYVFILSCDMPLMTVPVVEKLLASLNDDEIVVPRLTDGKIEPLCAIYSVRLLNKIEKQMLRSCYKMTELIKSSASNYVDFKDAGPFFNINHPGELNARR